MNTKLKKIAKTAAIGIFFMALFLNVKLSLTDPFVTISNDALAQTSSSSSSCSTCTKCEVSHIASENQGGCTANPYGGGMCVRSGPGPLCSGTINS
ncbi:hypothetical protein C8N25_1339 [Algoriphagus antarcticus]|uniref:Uncharacterized protein n=1 Tax=Algoriphagus antarcticus TaxID=238540 RepID=A0A3E0D753_9BACT|nr:hypothetical protein C8N25_1339 [Algoriphagus antarcticus]